MNEFDRDVILINPPAFSTVRFNPCQISASESIQKLKQFCINEIIKNFETFKPNIDYTNSEILIQPHPVLNDVLIIEHESIKKFLEKFCNKELNSDHTTKEIIVDKRCGLSVMRGSHIYLPGIVSSSPGIYKNCVVDVFIDVDKKCLKGSKHFSGNKFFIGKGISQYNRKEIFCDNEINTGIGIKMISPVYPAPSLSNFALPENCFAQNLPSIIATHVLAPSPGSVVLDMCAAPGGKTTHLCSLMEGRGIVISLDKSKNRVEKIKENVKLLNFDHMVHVHVVDSRYILNIDSSKSLTQYSPPFEQKSFQYILLDAPCSGLGQRPRFLNDVRNEKELKSFPPLQRQLFKTAYELLSVNGSLVYCTCTIVPEENELIIDWALNEFPLLELCSQSPHIGSSGRKGCTNLSDNLLEKLQYFPMPNESVTKPINNSPNYHPVNNDTIGFFIAKFKKRNRYTRQTPEC